jgi:hypothetical protein
MINRDIADQWISRAYSNLEREYVQFLYVQTMGTLMLFDRKKLN